MSAVPPGGRVEHVIRDVAGRGVGPYTSAPPLVGLLWRLGLTGRGAPREKGCVGGASTGRLQALSPGPYPAIDDRLDKSINK